MLNFQPQYEQALIKAIPDVKKMYSTQLFFMELRLTVVWFQNQKIPRDGAEIN
jgi:hypothetical protein